ncbi:MAG TPA: hypothetical protein VMN60_03440 [Longimicrobiales bacterium]|nr:hypothetical protein [Longimicrobiales bacterium]
MCNLRGATVVALLALAGSAAAHAQSDAHAEWRAQAAERRARIDSLLPLYRQAVQADSQRQRRDRAEELARAGKLDTATVGFVRITGHRGDVAQAVPLFEEAWRAYEPWLGDEAARLAGVVFVVRGEAGDALVRTLYHEPRHYVLDLPSVIQRADRMRVVRAVLGQPLRSLMPLRVQAWVGEGSFGAGRGPDRTYRELALGASRGAVQCRDGDIATCIGILGVDGDADWLRYYTAAQVRDVVRQRRVGGYSFTRCVELRQDTACVTALRGGGPGGMLTPAPVSADARALLLEQALRRGGARSFERLIADSTADVRTALSAASGVRIEPLVEAWRAEVLSARPSATAALGRSLLVTLFWIALLIKLATRSTRWRIG